MTTVASKRLMTLILLYMTASLIHFIHNAEFLISYPGLPGSWTRAGVYLAWLGMTCVGVVGLFSLTRGFTVFGLLAIGVYSVMGMDSLGHYVVAPFSSHTAAMNVTILLEVCTAALLLAEVMRLALSRGYRDRTSPIKRFEAP